MTTSPPEGLIGTRETQRLEFKSSDSLRKPTTIAREVVAFLNADGGDVWIGLQESDGVASAVERIPRVAAECIDLHNHLIDAIEPSPTNTEANVEVIGTALRVRVARGHRKPYALRKDRGRQYILRVGDRVREMTREEIAEEFRVSDSGEKSLQVIEDAEKRVQEGIDKERNSRRPRLWWELVVAPPLKTEFGSSDQQFFNEILTDPRQSGNRPNGWTMTLFHDRWPRVGPTEIDHVFGEGDFEHRVSVRNDGTMTFVAPLLRLNRVPWETDMREIFSFALLELPVSAFRIASKVLDRLGAGDSDRKIVCGAVLGGIGGMTLRPGSPNEPSRPWKSPGKVNPDQTDIAIAPFTLGANELISGPDAAAYQLIRRFYYEFGLEEEDIPREFDRQSHILRFSN